MLLVTHGGLCCGIKTIHSLGTNPNVAVPALKKDPRDGAAPDGYGQAGGVRWYTNSAPEESGIKRLERYLSFADKKRTRQVIEVVLASADCSCCSQDAWEPILTERGFRKVTSFKNSNSGNICHIFHRNTGVIEEKIIEPVTKA